MWGKIYKIESFKRFSIFLHKIESSKKLEKNNTRTLSLIIHTGWDFCKMDINIQRGMKLRKPSILIVNRVSSCLSFFLSASTAATYIFNAPNCTTPIISLESCALFCWVFSISYWDLLKCLYFADSTERGERVWREAQRQGEESMFLKFSTFVQFF